MPKKIYICLLFFTVALTSFGQSANDSIFDPALLHAMSLLNVSNGKAIALQKMPPETIRMFVFLSPECPICQNYTSILNQFRSKYAGKMLVYGIFPGKAYQRREIRSFGKKYAITYPLLIDQSFRLSRYLQATTTPEVIVLDAQCKLIYKGAIDNRFKSLGKSRLRATENYLQDAVDQFLRKEEPTLKRTTPVGCLLNDY